MREFDQNLDEDGLEEIKLEADEGNPNVFKVKSGFSDGPVNKPRQDEDVEGRLMIINEFDL